MLELVCCSEYGHELGVILISFVRTFASAFRLENS
nr:MAG TPA: hypothetical protein [Caudoviricetes sp.]